MNAPDHKADVPCVRHACKRREVEMRAEIEKLRQRCASISAAAMKITGTKQGDALLVPFDQIADLAIAVAAIDRAGGGDS
jgi:hypothetical protein